MKNEQVNRPKLIIIAGATAVGKSDLSIRLAKKIGGQIISADSMQVYRGMDIGTAKIRPDEMDGVKHYLIDELDPSDEFNVFVFQSLAKKYIRQIYAEGKIPILVGGTGFYIQSVLYDIDFSEEGGDRAYRKELEEKAAQEGPAAVYALLEAIDPEASEQIHPHNVKRVIRALEYYRETGEKISDHNRIQREKESPYDVTYVVLNRDRALIYDRINQRVDQMIKEGLVEEVQALLGAGVSPDCVAMQGLGYKEMVRYLHKELSLEEAAALIKQSTRHFAKRQITWFKREPDAVWLDYADYPSVDAMVDKIISLAGLHHS